MPPLARLADNKAVRPKKRTPSQLAKESARAPGRVDARRRRVAGHDALDAADWRAFLTKLVEKIVVGPTELEVHLVLPAAQVASQRTRPVPTRMSLRLPARSTIATETL